MSPKTATVRLYVAVVSLAAALLELAATFVRLAAALLGRAARAVRARADHPTAPQVGRPHLRVVPQPGRRLPVDARARLTFALIGMGFHAPAVRAFVAGLGDRADREPIDTLIKEGLAKLAA
jgi:hypothetical protein